MAFLRACSAQNVTLRKRQGRWRRDFRKLLGFVIRQEKFRLPIFYSPIFPFHFWCSVGAALAVLGGDIAALLVRGVFVLQNVLDAELQAFKTGLRAWSLGKGAGLRLLGSGRLGHPVPTRGQNVDSYPVHCKVCKK